MIQLHQLEGFYRVANAGGYARAAREFPYPISQPGVFAQVRRLEEQLGIRVLEKVAKDRVVPTRAGRTLLAFCTPFFEHLPEVVGAIVRGAAAGVLRLEAGALEIQEILPAWLRRVRAALPDVEIELRQIEVPDHGRLLRGETDLIVEHQPAVPVGISTRPVGAHRPFLVAPQGHPLLRGRRGKAQDFLGEPFISFHPSQPQHALQMNALRALGREPQRVTVAPTVASILSFVAAGLGYSLVPWPDPKGPQFPGVAVRRLGTSQRQFPIVAAWRTRAEVDPVLDAVLRLAPR